MRIEHRTPGEDAAARAGLLPKGVYKAARGRRGCGGADPGAGCGAGDGSAGRNRQARRVATVC